MKPRNAVTMNSRQRIETTIQGGTIARPQGTAERKTNEPQMMTLSAAGSAMRPKSLTWPSLRA
jgi:hypothetical protein